MLAFHAFEDFSDFVESITSEHCHAGEPLLKSSASRYLIDSITEMSKASSRSVPFDRDPGVDSNSLSDDPQSHSVLTRHAASQGFQQTIKIARSDIFTITGPLALLVHRASGAFRRSACTPD
jgi:hypothetical protein